MDEEDDGYERWEQQRFEEQTFRDELIDHIDANPKGCDLYLSGGRCNYCLTYGDILRDTQGR